jgi:DNA-binding transcriptional ArsR family regulator
MSRVPTIGDPRYVKAVSHPLRVRILAMLSEEASSPRQISTRLDASLGVVSYHVRTLDRLGMIELVGERRVRGAVEHYYEARARPPVTTDDWDQAPAVAKQAEAAAQLQVIHDYARTSADRGGFDAETSQLTRAHFELDETGRAELAAACSRLAEEAEKIAEAARERIAAADGDAGGAPKVALVTMLFEAARLSDPVAPIPANAQPVRRRRRSPARSKSAQRRSSRTAIVRLWTSSGPSASRSVRMCA